MNFTPSREGKKYFVKTFGCQMNEHDSEKIAGMFELDGMTKATLEDSADIMFINTCTIRENADIALQLETDVYKAVGMIDSDDAIEEETVEDSEDATPEK